MLEAHLLHELKNQLGIILGFAEMLVSDASADDPRREDLAEIHRAAQRAMALVREAAPGGGEL